MTQQTTLYDGDTFEHRGYTFHVRIEPDQDHGAPWEENDGHGIVSEWTTRDKAPGERVLASDRSHRRYYDVVETLAIAKRDGWGTADGRRDGESAKAYAARAVEADFEYLRRWCADDWQYVGVIVSAVDEDGNPDDDLSLSLWGVESLNDHPSEIARELADELMARIEVDQPRVVRGEN